MDTWKRLIRRPVSTALWLALLTLAALLIGIAVSLYASARGVPAALDAREMTIAVHKAPAEERNEDGSFSFQPQFAVLYDEDIEYLRSLPQVKDIDFRYLSGAYIEGVTAKLGLSDWFGMEQDVRNLLGQDLNAGHKNVLLIGTVEDSFTLDWDSITRYDLSAFGGPEDVGERYNAAIFRVEEAVVMHPDYPLAARYEGDEYYDGRVTLMFNAFGDNKESFFKKGVRYAVQGEYDPLPSGRGHDYPVGEQPLLPNVEEHAFGLSSDVPLLSAFREGDSLAVYSGIEIEELGNPFEAGYECPYVTKIVSRGERYPVAVEWNGTAEELQRDEYWGGLAKTYEMALSSFPVLGTNSLESIYSFVKNEAKIVSGRSFTNEEYASGAKVLVMDEGVASSAGLQVGDKVNIRQFQPAIGYAEDNYSFHDGWYSMDGEYNNPTLGGSVFIHGLPEGEPEEFTIVGLYRIENEWKNSTCSFTPNTVFMPRGAQTELAYGGPSVLLGTNVHTRMLPDGRSFEWEEPEVRVGGVNGVYMSIILKNGTMDDFLQRIRDDTVTEEYEYEANGEKTTDVFYRKGLGGHTILCFDQGYSSAKESMVSAVSQTGRLALLMLAGAALIFLTYILIHQTGERKTLGIMRSLGAEPKTARAYLFTSGLVIAAAGAVIGTLLAALFAGGITDKLVGAAMGEGAELFRDMLRESAVPARVCALTALAEILLAALVLFAHASVTASKNPRKLLGKG